MPLDRQDPLFEDPPWTAYWQIGDRVRSVYTSNSGTVTYADPLGRHLLIHWDNWLNEPDGYTARHHSESGLERLP